MAPCLFIMEMKQFTAVHASMINQKKSQFKAYIVTRSQPYTSLDPICYLKFSPEKNSNCRTEMSADTFDQVCWFGWLGSPWDYKQAMELA